MKVTAFIPIKLNNERTPGKNIRPFLDGTPVCHLIQKTLLQVPEINEIIVYCSDERIQEYLLPGVHYMKRPASLDTYHTPIADVFGTFLKNHEADIYVMAHVTCPFIKPERFSESIRAVVNGGYDSAFSGKKITEFLWKEGEPLNFSRNQIPRTQDLPVILAETTSFYVFTRDVYEKYNGRVGIKPFICECSAIESIDIDWPEDFTIAEAVYNHILADRK